MILVGVEFVDHLVRRDDKIHVGSFVYANNFEAPATYMYNYESSIVFTI